MWKPTRSASNIGYCERQKSSRVLSTRRVCPYVPRKIKNDSILRSVTLLHKTRGLTYNFYFALNTGWGTRKKPGVWWVFGSFECVNDVEFDRSYLVATTNAISQRARSLPSMSDLRPASLPYQYSRLVLLSAYSVNEPKNSSKPINSSDLSISISI